jgi:hypothetical protein
MPGACNHGAALDVPLLESLPAAEMKKTLPLARVPNWVEQLAVEPPLEPAQAHDHGPIPLTTDAVPTLQSAVVGGRLLAVPFAAPHCPFTPEERSEAEQLAVEPPWVPAQLHDQGPVPATDEAVPAEHNPVVGALETDALFDTPQVPLTLRLARPETVLPPFDPMHDHVQPLE